jgi:hypothetical protein
MENNNSSRDTSPLDQKTDLQQLPTQSQEPKKGFPSKYLLLGIAAVLLIVASVGATYFLMNRDSETLITQDPEQSNSVSPTSAAPTTSPDTSTLVAFTDQNIEGMTFQYDPLVWELTKITSKNIDEVPKGFNKVFGESGVLMKEKNSDGVLFMKYGYEVGRGGATGAIYKDHIKKLSKTTRIKINDNNYYIYGLNNPDLYDIFSEEPESKENYTAMCSPDYEGYMGISDEVCADLESGEVIGFFGDPTFSWSLRLNRIGETTDIWDDVSYLGELKPDTVIIETQYMGTNPENADAIVTQLFK